MKRNELTVKDLDPSDVQSALDNLRANRAKSTTQILEDLERALLLAVELIPEFGKRALEAIRKKHPDLFDDMTS
jgi:3-keto-L-gulonate-6-phosphate decarboxylase